MSEEILIYVYVLAGILGLCVGSFLNVVIYRLPKEMSLSKPSSRCTTCGYKLRWYDNVPIISYLILGGKCRSCGQKISPRYIAVECLNAILWLASALVFAKENVYYAILVAILTSCLVCIFFIDLEHLIIFDRFHIIISCLAIIAIFIDKRVSWQERLIGFGVGAVVLLLIYYLSILIYKKEGIGFGDVKLFAVCGLFLGVKSLILSLIISSVIASVVLVIVSKIKKKEKGTEYPFGPFITVAVLISVFVGEYIVNWYLSLLTI